MDAEPRTNQDLMQTVDDYFATVTDDQFLADLAKADFGFYNTLGRSLLMNFALGNFPVVSTVLRATDYHPLEAHSQSGSYEEYPVAA